MMFIRSIAPTKVNIYRITDLLQTEISSAASLNVLDGCSLEVHTVEKKVLHDLVCKFPGLYSN